MSRSVRRAVLFALLLAVLFVIFEILDDDGEIRIEAPSAPIIDGAGATTSKNRKSSTTLPLHRHDLHDELSHDLSAIDDPVNELAAMDDGMLQIHHGIYKVQSRLSNGGKLRFAFKTECRRASKWHGQQGWSEVATYHFTRLFYEQHETPQFATAPAARGVFVKISDEQLNKIVHRDHCGVVPKDQYRLIPSLKVDDELMTGKKILLVGVALTWQPSHNDNALPTSAVVLPLFASSSQDLPSLSRRNREIASQISDVQAMDYLLINDDREEKNWFKDESGRFVMMDNGWAFAGRSYEGSICSNETELLQCTPLFRHVASSKRCVIDGGGGNRILSNCRYRAETAQGLLDIVGVSSSGLNETSSSPVRTRHQLVTSSFESKFLSEWLSALRQDPLIMYLINVYGAQEVQSKKKTLSVALERYVHGCSAMPEEFGKADLLVYLRYGLAVRMVALVEHIGQCVATLGEEYVFGSPLTSQPPEAN